MPSVDALISQNITNATTNKQTWEGIGYNTKSYDLKGDGTTDDYTAFYSLINTTIAGAEATIILGKGTYRIGTNLIIPETVKLLFTKGAKLSPDSGKTVTINGPIDTGAHQIFTGNGTITGNIKLSQVYPEWWGAKLDGTSDDYAAIQKAVDYAFDNGRLPVILSNDAVTSNKLQLTKGGAAADPVSLIGVSTETVTLKAHSAFPINTPMVEVFGGSGGVTKAVVKNILLDGNNVTGIIGINNRGVGGFRAVDCTFKNMKYGFRLSNTDGGNFTEFSYAENCWFQITVEIAIHYYRTNASAGAKSFHGSGILGGIINISTSGAAIKLQDDSGAGDAIVYNAPIHCTLFENGTFISTNSTISMRTYGIIRIESTGMTLGVGAGGINHCGAVQTINSAPTYGTFNLNGLKETSGLLEANFYNARLRGTSGLKILDDAHPTWIGYDGGGTSTGALCYCWNAYYDGGWKGYKTGKRCLILHMDPTTGAFKVSVAAAPASDGGAISVSVVAGMSAAGALMVGNSANATTLGSVVKKMEVFDANGASLGFVPIYNSIT